MCVLSHFSRVQFCATLWTVDHQALLSMAFSRQEYWSGLLFPPPGNLPNPEMELEALLCLLHWRVGSLPLAPPGKPVCVVRWKLKGSELFDETVYELIITVTSDNPVSK